MASLKSIGTTGGGGTSPGVAPSGAPSHGEVLKMGNLRKQKTMRKKFFVLKAESPESSARLEYYDDEKKWRKQHQPKRSIVLKTCFNINKRKLQDTKLRNIIDLYTKDDCFSIVFDTEEELEEWLRPMLFLQHGEELWDGEPPKPTFEHVWQVEVMERGLGSQSKIRGSYRLCLTDQQLSLVPNGNSKLNTLDFSLVGIRRCGASNDFLYIEVGRSSVTGEGDIYMATTDSVIAANMRDIILQAMSNSKKDDLAPKQRLRSSSATESSKPSSLNLSRRQMNMCPLNIKLNQLPANAMVSSGGTSSNSSTTVKSHHQRTYSLPVSPDVNLHIDNENNNGLHTTSNSGLNDNNYVPKGASVTSIVGPQIFNEQDQCNMTRRGSVGNKVVTNNAKRHNRSSAAGSIKSGRERCDSLPSRARTTSEGQMPRSIAHHLRPRSMYTHDSPASPPSNCSTDSAGSSLSMDETDWVSEPQNDGPIMGRFNHSLTPDEHIIVEENDDCDGTSYFGKTEGYSKNSPNISSGIHSESPSGASCGSSPLDVNSGYVPMCPGDTGYVDMGLSPAASSCSVTSGTPSTDYRFYEYHLDKVTSYIPLEPDELTRPLRTYSVGSKPQRVEKTKIQEATRARAFSVGSHTKTGRNLKASSAPAPLVVGSPMSHLMELDFRTNANTSRTPTSGYVEMRPGSQTSNHNSGYVEMKPGVTKDSGPYVDMSGSLGASPNKHLSNNYNSYMEMSGNYKLGSSPKSSKGASPKDDSLMNQWRGSEYRKPVPEGYMEMTCKPQRKPLSLSQSSNTSDDYLNMSGSKTNGYGKKKEHRQDKTRSKPIAIQPNSTSSPPKIGAPTFLPLQTGKKSSPLSSPSVSNLPLNQRTRKTPETPPTPVGNVFPFNMSGFQTPDSSRKCQVDATSGTVKLLTSDSTSCDNISMPFHKTPSTGSFQRLQLGCEDHFCKPLSSTPMKDMSEYVNYNPTANFHQTLSPGSPESVNGFEYGEYAIMKPGGSGVRPTPVRKTSAPALSSTKREVITQPLINPYAKAQNHSHQVQIVKPGANMTNLPQSSFKPITANLPKLDTDTTEKTSNSSSSVSPKTIDNLFTRQLSSTNDKRSEFFGKSCETVVTTKKSVENCSDSSNNDSSSSTTVCSDPASRPNSANSEKLLSSKRPASVNSEKLTPRPSSVSSEGSLSQSRPSSSSSDLNSSSSTLVGSRPPSVSSERELLYITVEHETEKNGGNKSPRDSKNQAGNTDKLTNNVVPSQNEPKIPYTSIDFVATDGLKQVSSPPAALASSSSSQNTKVKH